MNPRRAQSFLFEPGAFALDPVVLAMNPTEVGAYILLLCAAWSLPEPGVIPDNDTALSYLSRTGQAWPKCREAVSRAFDTESRPGFWVQKRMVETHRHQARWFSKQSLAGALGGKTKAANAKARLATKTPLGFSTGTGIGSVKGIGKKKERETRARKALPIPKLEEAVAYAKQNCPTIDAERWWHYQTARGWKTRSGPIVDWHSAMRTWVNNGYDNTGGIRNGTSPAPERPKGPDPFKQKIERWRLEKEREEAEAARGTDKPQGED